MSTNELLQPHEFFTQAERAVWRSLVSSSQDTAESWVEFPGPASWWPIDYEYKKHGWVGALDPQKACTALALVMRKYKSNEVPKDADRLSDSLNNLMIE